MRSKLLTLALLLLSLGAVAQKAAIYLEDTSSSVTIDPNIYGMFSEHLGRGIYGGIWVPEDAKLKKEGRIRMDVVEALREIHIPNLRWPGGCFADEYHWMDGIGDPASRPKMVNTNWGGVTEDNSFGTNEFMQLCRLLNTEPYISGNMGSGTVQEMSNWVEYLNFDGLSPMTEKRKQDGVDKPYGVQYFGIGNESWGCGGSMTPEYYVNEFRRYATFAKSYKNAPLKRIASGANSDDYNWTEVLMKGIPHNLMWGLSLHYYTIPTGNWGKKGSATDFDESEYLNTMKNCLHMEQLFSRHSAIMDKYDPNKKVAMVVDEWGVWTDPEPGTNPSFLYQQNSMRDALIAATTLNIFNNHADRVKMANLAQTVNVLQSLILTNEHQIVLTPTYYVFDMFKLHQGAKLVPLEVISPNYKVGDKSIKAINASGSIDGSGKMHVSLVNLDAGRQISTSIDLSNTRYSKVSGSILTGGALTAINTFEFPDNVRTKKFFDAKISGSKGSQILHVQLPAHSVVMLELE